MKHAFAHASVQLIDGKLFFNGKSAGALRKLF